MTRTSLPVRVRRLAASVAALMTVGAVGLVAGASSAAAWSPSCGESTYIHKIAVEQHGDGSFKIQITPTGAARADINPGHVTNEMWHAVQDCVPGLYGTLADSIYDQLQCHQHLALVPSTNGFATGDTYDLESSHPPFDAGEWVSSHCGNQLQWPGQVDLQEYYSRLA